MIESMNREHVWERNVAKAKAICLMYVDDIGLESIEILQQTFPTRPCYHVQ